MPRDPYVRYKFTHILDAALQQTREYFDRYPKDRYETVVESWREVRSRKFEFTMRRLREPVENETK
jgi:ribosomal protein L32E